MKSTIYIILSLVFISCSGSQKKLTKEINQVQLTNEIDPDIVIINVEEGDRTFIGNLISIVDSCSPKVIRIDAYFTHAKDDFQDSALQHALSSTDKDIIACKYDTTIICAIERFDTIADKGLSYGIVENGLMTKFVPITLYKGKIYEHFALKVVRKWNPVFEPKYKANEEIPIQYKRKTEQYMTVKGSLLNYDKYAKFLKGKIVLLGYLGPSNENKIYTPIRLVKKFPKEEPDTYGIILVANEIRQILDNIGK
jgi:CHASE2 domain-containing sensor protein